MAKLDLEWLSIFVQVYRTRSVSRAAEHLGLAQASASIALGKLRKHFGDRLFSRTSRGMEPTPYAETLYPELADVLVRLEKARGARADFDPLRSERRFAICITDISEIVLLPTMINHLQRTAPGIVLEAEKISTDSPRRLENGDVDLAVGFMPGLEAGFHQQTLFAQDYVCLASADHPRVRPPLSAKALSSERHLLVTPSGTGHAVVDKVLRQSGIERRVVLRLPSFLGVARVVAQTELVVIVPRLLGQALAIHERVQVLESPVTLPSYAVKQHWHERFHADVGNVWLRRTMAQLFAKQAGARRPTAHAARR